MALGSTLARAEAWRFEPYARLSTNYEDNRRLSVSDERSSFATRLSGAVAISRETEVTNVRGGLELGYVWFTGDDKDNLRDQNTLLALLDASHRTSARNEFRLRFRAKKDSTVTSVRGPDNVENELPGDDPDDDDGLTGDPDDGLTSQDVERIRIRFEPSWVYRLTERSSFRLTYRYDDLQYDDNDRSSLSDQSANSVGASLNYRVDEISRARLTVRYGKTDREQSDNTEVYSVQAGYRRDLSEVYSVDGSLGGYHTKRGNRTNNGGLVNFSLSRQMRGGSWRLRLRQGLGLSGSGNVVDDTNLTFRYTQAVNPRTSFDVRARYLLSKSAESSGSDDRHYLSIEPALRWRWDRWTRLSISYRYRRREFDGSSDWAQSNGLFATLVWSRAQDL